jgi:hypothetical protein
VGLKVGEGVLDENDLVFAKEFLTWMKQAILMAK